MAQAELLRAVSLESLLKCGLSELESRIILENLVKTLRSVPATEPTPLVSLVGAVRRCQRRSCRRVCLLLPPPFYKLGFHVS